MRLVTATPNSLYCDTDQVLTPLACKLLLSKGILGVWRYLSGLTIGELNVILDSGLELYFLNYSGAPGWVPSAAEGKLDAERDISLLHQLAIPTGPHVVFDLEGPGGTADLVNAHIIAHGTDILKAQYSPALYLGEAPRITSSQASKAPSRLYWHGCSMPVLDESGVAIEPWCGYSVEQGNPFDVVLTDGVTNVTIDYDYVRKDNRGRLPIGVKA